MSWACELTEDAQKDLRDLPRTVQARIARVLDQMTTDLFQSGIKSLHGKEWRGVFRRRIGSYRILFTADHTKHTVTVIRILIRSKGTYR
jgi:mRNA-degrading endonuclease RelE of RelBE toxin-antitoxin system